MVINKEEANSEEVKPIFLQVSLKVTDKSINRFSEEILSMKFFENISKSKVL